MHSRYKGFNDRNEHSHTYAVRLIGNTLQRQVSIREEYSHHVSHHAIQVWPGATAQVADVCVEALVEEAASNRVVEITQGDASQPTVPIAQLFQQTRPRYA